MRWDNPYGLIVSNPRPFYFLQTFWSFFVCAWNLFRCVPFLILFSLSTLHIDSFHKDILNLYDWTSEIIVF